MCGASRFPQAALGRPLTVLYANMTDLRWDAAARTGDCLRSCLPGPVDVWARLLFRAGMLVAVVVVTTPPGK